MRESQAIESQTGGAALSRVIVVGLGPLPVRGVHALREVYRSALLRVEEISALLIDSAKCFILFKEKGLVRAYSGTEIATQTLGGVI